MAISYHPYLAYDNLLFDEAAVLSSDQVASDSDINNLLVSNLGVVTALTGTTSEILIDLGEEMPVNAVFLRFRAGWSTITGIQVRGADNSLLATPVYDVTSSSLFPSRWPRRIPRRPVFRQVFEEVSAQYWCFTITRDDDSEDLEIAAAFVGPGRQLNTLIDGIAAYGLVVDVESASEELQADVDTDFRFARSQRRFSTIKLEAVNEERANSEWYQNLMFAQHHADVLYVYNPLATDPKLIHLQTLWGSAKVSGFTYNGYDAWEGSVALKERI